jgi:hypothetical protein
VLLQCDISRFSNDLIWTRVKDEIRTNEGWFKSTKVFSLPAVCAYFRMPGKEVVCNNLTGRLREIYSTITSTQITDQVEKKIKKHIKIKDSIDDITQLREWIVFYNTWTETEIITKLHHLESFSNLFKKYNFTRNFEKAKILASQKILAMKYDELIIMWKITLETKENYLDDLTSAAVMLHWCEIQNIDPVSFAKNIISFIDMKLPKINSLWLHGESNAGKSYIVRSLSALCCLYHQVPAGSNRFMWQDAIEKRLIILNEPLLDETAIESSKEIFEGTGCFVPVKMKHDQFLPPTPVAITSNTHLWAFNASMKLPIQNRIYCGGYVNLKPVPLLKNINKELNPLWINVLVNESMDNEMYKSIINDIINK